MHAQQKLANSSAEQLVQHRVALKLKCLRTGNFSTHVVGVRHTKGKGSLEVTCRAWS